MAVERYFETRSSSQRNGSGRGEGRPTRRAESSDPLLSHTPPNSVDAEQSVLGAILLDNGRGALERAMEILQPDDFYREVHGSIFEAMIALQERSEPVDPITLKAELVRKNIYDLIGGQSYLMELGDVVPTSAHVAHYANIVSEKATLRRLIQTSQEITGLAYGQAEEVDTLLDRAERAIFEVARKRNTQPFYPMHPLLLEAFDQIDHLHRNKGSVTGVDTGFRDLNHITSGFQKGDLIIVAARPSMGKTALCLNIGQYAALKGGRSVAVFSLEMSRGQLAQRMMCAEARVDAHRVRTGYLNDNDWQRITDALGRLWDAKMYIDDSTDIGILEMRAKCRRLRAENDLDLIIVDYLQLMRSSGRNNENRNQEITEIARGLKNLARELEVPVVALSQLSRAVERREDKRPMLSDLRESGSIEAEADVVGFIYRPAYYERKTAVHADDPEAGHGGSDHTQEEPMGEEAEIIIAKQRNGPVGTVKLSFLPKYARFENLAEYREESPF